MAEVEGEEEEEEEEEYPVPQYPLHEAVAVQPSPMGGSGLFALRDFAQGDGELRDGRGDRAGLGARGARAGERGACRACMPPLTPASNPQRSLKRNRFSPYSTAFTGTGVTPKAALLQRCTCLLPARLPVRVLLCRRCMCVSVRAAWVPDICTRNMRARTHTHTHTHTHIHLVQGKGYKEVEAAVKALPEEDQKNFWEFTQVGTRREGRMMEPACRRCFDCVCLCVSCVPVSLAVCVCVCSGPNLRRGKDPAGSVLDEYNTHLVSRS